MYYIHPVGWLVGVTIHFLSPNISPLFLLHFPSPPQKRYFPSPNIFLLFFLLHKKRYFPCTNIVLLFLLLFSSLMQIKYFSSSDVFLLFILRLSSPPQKKIFSMSKYHLGIKRSIRYLHWFLGLVLDISHFWSKLRVQKRPGDQDLFWGALLT